MKILLPACFIALKLTGTFIDFMLGLSNSKDIHLGIKGVFAQGEESLAVRDFKTSEIGVLDSETVKSFSFRTCVNPKLIEQDSGETKIVYQSLTAKESLRK